MKIKPIFFPGLVMLLLCVITILPMTTRAEHKERTIAPQQLTYISENIPTASEKLVMPAVQTPPVDPKPLLPEEDVRLIALLTMAEAESEPEDGKRLVIDTVLNRVDDPRFPSNVHDVIYQHNQYSGILSPRIDRCWVKDELVKLVLEELVNRSNSEVIFFRTEHYSKYGTPMFQVGHHYFSSY